MFLDVTLRRNHALVDTAITLHRDGAIPPNSYVLDLDAIARNAQRIAGAAADTGLQCFQMTKQFGRNPLAAAVIADNGIPAAVAVDADEALVLAGAGIELGHVGHLVQLPVNRVSAVLAYRPRLVTVFGLPQAEILNRFADGIERPQTILIRVVDAGDTVYPAQQGGTALNDLAATVDAMAALDNLVVGGVTSFPCMIYDGASGDLRPTRNLQTLLAAARTLRGLGIDPVVNAPSANCVASMRTLAQRGATQVEPGSSLIGNTPLHAASDQPEEPAMVYVSEVSHWDATHVYTHGGGHYARSRVKEALVDTARGRVRAPAVPTVAGYIDYYGALDISPDSVSVGDSVVYAFRSQVFVSRATVAAVSGIGGSPRLEGLFDHLGRPVAPITPPAPDRTHISER